MAKLSDVCRHIRSKNAGPFWITIDLFFADAERFARYAHTPALASEAIARLYGVPSESVRKFVVPELAVVKFSYPRAVAQGGPDERDMHGGQQYVRLCHVEV
ncbi:DUF4387 domain-containing protein [Sphingobium subterraneum]|uniref:DUF4387 domain-containing protein n=1 Tax=Sphingobium subterraneum TaxID=627688 RepID=A0A841J0B3_9SPHN|nr:DUF4387 domain-containing protein [Sphingobium subterraneum]MBB6123792.1 hypothetical protein [Sphingobium subterraneum]